MRKTTEIILCALFAALIAVGAFIRIPVPYVSVTLQTLFVLLAGMLLGKKSGAVSCLVYLIMGLCGVPVFTKGGGIMYILEPTFGYLPGFVLCAYITGQGVEKRKKTTFMTLFTAGLKGLAALYLTGLLYMYGILHIYMQTPIQIRNFLLLGVLIPLLTDILSCACGAWIGIKVKRSLRFI